MAGHWHKLTLACVAAAVGAYYLWELRAAGHGFDFRDSHGGYYNYLGRAVAHGRLALPIEPAPALLALPNPWDPGVDDALKMHDMALYGGRYYLYHGVAPAVLLFAPWFLATGHDLPENFALWLLCCGGFLFSCGTLLRWLALADATPPPLLVAAMLLALGLCQAVPYLLSRVWVYEVAIGGGYFCLSGAMYFLACGIGSTRSRYWLGASGMMFGLAIACRPHLGIAGVIALIGLWVLLGRWRSEILVFAGAFALVGVAVAAYNYGRFGDPFEFGLRYLLSGVDQNRLRLAPANVLPGMYFFLACPPHLGPVFPWFRPVLRWPFNSLAFAFPPGYFIEATVGALYLAPFVVLDWLLPGVRARGPIRILLWTAGVSSAAVLLFLTATGFTTQRYVVDFLPTAVLVALVRCGIRIHSSRGARRVLLAGVLVVLMAGGVVVNVALGIAGPLDEMAKNRPRSFVRIAGWFSPLEQFRPVMNPEIDVTFTAELGPGPDGFNEPLVTIGHPGHRYFLYLEHAGGRRRLVSRSESSTMRHDLADRASPHATVRLTYDRESGKLTTAVDGAEVLVHEVGTLVTAPAEVTVGENLVDPGVTRERFTGQIRDVVRTVRAVRGRE